MFVYGLKKGIKTMAIDVNGGNFNQVLNYFKDFVQESQSRGKMGAKAYLFPGFTSHDINRMEHPIFAQRSNGIFRSRNDKVANDYVRQLLMDCVAARLNCATSELPAIFKWAGELDNLKIADFGKGRPLTARRIDAILTATKNIEAKFATEKSEMRISIDEGIAANDFNSLSSFVKDSLPTNVMKKLPKFAAATFESQMQSYTAKMDLPGDDINILTAREKVTEQYEKRFLGTMKSDVQDQLKTAIEDDMTSANRAKYLAAKLKDQEEEARFNMEEDLYLEIEGGIKRTVDLKPSSTTLTIDRKQENLV